MFDSVEAAQKASDIAVAAALFTLLIMVLMLRRQITILKEMIDNQQNFIRSLAKTTSRIVDVIERKVE